MNEDENSLTPPSGNRPLPPLSPEGELNFEEQRRTTLSKLEEELVSPSVENPPESDIVRRLRTLKGDVEDSLRGGRTTVISVASAASRARSIEPPVPINPEPKFSKLTILGIAGGIFLLIGGVGAIIWSSISQDEEIIISENTEPLLYTEGSATLDVADLSERRLREEMITLRESLDGRLGSITQIIPIEKTETGEFTVSADQFLSLIDSSIPNSLTRSLEPHFLAGIHSFDGNQWFFIFKTGSYEQAFAGMLQYERGLQRGLGTIVRREKDYAFATSTALQLSLLNFRDSVIKNKDVRMITNPEGKVLLLYSFIDRNTLIIAGNQETLGEIIERLSSARRVN